jgi:hypothetical protein
MKKALIAAVLGITLKATVSHGQGYIVMESYKLVGGVTPVYSAVSYYSGGPYVGAANGWKADLLFSLDGGNTFLLAAGSQTPFFAGSHDGGSPTTDGAGVFVGGNVTIPGYTSGPATFIVQAYNGASYASSSFAGRSAPFTISSLQTDPLQAAGTILDLSGTTVNGMQPFIIAIPEPSIFALAGLSAAGLMAIRRKK